MSERASDGPSRVVIVRDGAILVREIQLPFQAVVEQLMGVCGQVVVYDVRELLSDIEQMKSVVLEIVETCSAPIGRSCQ